MVWLGQLQLSLKMKADIELKQEEYGQLNELFEKYRREKYEEMERLKEEKDQRIKRTVSLMRRTVG